ncbi:DUF1622 domain-containing protein [Legionella feeleii]|uniref:Protein of uncharacterized function (DUF1622) n=1 Tax=Legionella feeleii TaxID=453 RepID=A0A0W0TM96_9GAMM|nr:DUF1622 domain-containing protein [Legionella feeleii]KTC96714.1 hypothetical protein Lfee_1626 [Legionella feeleii]SPX60615.1 Protein of uncharacterised function (DUF1622) [Legionella feeleii]
MEPVSLHSLLLYIQHGISFCGVLVILIGVLTALFRYIAHPFYNSDTTSKMDINQIRLRLGRVLTLGLEFIVAADLIGTTTTPDYYSVGIVASIVLIRTLLSYTLNREINDISRQENQNKALA